MQTRLYFSGCFFVASVGRSDGLLLLWKDPMVVTINHIDFVVDFKLLVGGSRVSTGTLGPF